MIRTTIIGGALFLLPLAVVVFLLGQVFAVGLKIAQPIEGLSPVDHFGGVALDNVIALTLILLICFLAGLVARHATARRLVGNLEEWMLHTIPVYAMV